MKYRNPLAQLTPAETQEKYNISKKTKPLALVHLSDNTTLFLKDVNINKVEFIGGLWRYQDKFDYKITTVRDKKFVIGDKISNPELPKFEIHEFTYYKASSVGVNCYGYSISNYDYIVANFGNAWGYGRTVSDARAYLSSKIIDTVIKNPTICKFLLTYMKSANIK